MLVSKGGISRCWTLKYADSTAGVGFHIDILPSVPEDAIINALNNTPDAIAIIDNKAGVYSWSPSNPKGFIAWFEEQNVEFKNYLFTEARAMYDKAANVDIEDINRKTARSPLRQAIKILKNHKDKMFDENNKYCAPKSILITTLATHLYNQERDLTSTIYNILDGLEKYANLMKRGFTPDNDDILYRDQNGIWIARNPALPTENFIEDWGDSDASEHAKAFFNWVSKVKLDLNNIMNQSNKKHFIDSAFNVNFKSRFIDDDVPRVTTRANQPWSNYAKL